MKQINSRKVFITGMVGKPGAYPLSAPTTVLQLISMAGGLNEFADAKNIIIIRIENGTAGRVEVQLQRRPQGQEPEAEHRAQARRYGDRSLSPHSQLPRVNVSSAVSPS